MKILWFTNTHCSAAEKLGTESHRGGWLKSLEQHVNQEPGIELFISFYSTTQLEPFRFGNTMYHPVFRKGTRSRLSRYVNGMSGKPGDDAVEIQRLLAVIELVKPDIIHIHGTENNFGLIQAHTRLPVVISIQGILAPLLEKFYSGIPAADAKKYVSIREKLNFKSARYLYKQFQAKASRENAILKQARYVIGRTDWDRRIARLMAPASRYFYNSEILREAFYTHTWQKEAFNEQFTIVTISSGALYKGFEAVVNTAKILKQHSKLSFRWIVIGLNKWSAIVKLVRRVTGEDPGTLQVQLAGSKSESEILNILLSADMYCQVSHIENSPNSLCEAMLIGMPVLATYAGGTGSLIEDGTDGLLVQDGDPYAMAGAVMELANDFLITSSYGVNARVKALGRHDKSTITSDLVQIYREIKRTGSP